MKGGGRRERDRGVDGMTTTTTRTSGIGSRIAGLPPTLASRGDESYDYGAAAGATAWTTAGAAAWTTAGAGRSPSSCTGAFSGGYVGNWGISGGGGSESKAGAGSVESLNSVVYSATGAGGGGGRKGGAANAVGTVARGRGGKASMVLPAAGLSAEEQTKCFFNPEHIVCLGHYKKHLMKCKARRGFVMNVDYFMCRYSDLHFFRTKKECQRHEQRFCKFRTKVADQGDSSDSDWGGSDSIPKKAEQENEEKESEVMTMMTRGGAGTAEDESKKKRRGLGERTGRIITMTSRGGEGGGVRGGKRFGGLGEGGRRRGEDGRSGGENGRGGGGGGEEEMIIVITMIMMVMIWGTV